MALHLLFQSVSEVSVKAQSALQKPSKDKKKAQRLATATPSAGSLAPDSRIRAEETAEGPQLSEEQQPLTETQSAEESRSMEELQLAKQRQSPEEQLVVEETRVQESQPPAKPRFWGETCRETGSQLAEEPMLAEEPRSAEDIRSAEEPCVAETTTSWADEMCEIASLAPAAVTPTHAQLAREGGDGALVMPAETRGGQERTETELGAAKDDAGSLSLVKPEQPSKPKVSGSLDIRSTREAARDADVSETRTELQAPEASVIVETEAPTAMEAEHEWAPTTKKKGKKKRKGKGSRAATPAKELDVPTHSDGAESLRQLIEEIAGPVHMADSLSKPQELSAFEHEQMSHTIEDGDASALAAQKGKRSKSGSPFATPATELETPVKPEPTKDIGGVVEQSSGPEKATEPALRPNESAPHPHEVTCTESLAASALTSTDEKALTGKGEEVGSGPLVSMRKPRVESQPPPVDVLSLEEKDPSTQIESHPKKQLSSGAEQSDMKPTSPVMAEDEWATSNKSKKEKGKKSRGAAVSSDKHVSNAREVAAKASSLDSPGLAEEQSEDSTSRERGSRQPEQLMAASLVKQHVHSNRPVVEPLPDIKGAPKLADNEFKASDLESATAKASSESSGNAPDNQRMKEETERDPSQPSAQNFAQQDFSSQGLHASSAVVDTRTTKCEIDSGPASDNERHATASTTETEPNPRGGGALALGCIDLTDFGSWECVGDAG